MKEERIDGDLTYTGTAEEIVALLREHADLRDGSADFFGSAAMRRGADEIERGLTSVFKHSAVYRVDSVDSGQDEDLAELVDATDTP